MAIHNVRGKDAERLAESYLKRKGFELIERNFRCRVGEIDLVMRDRNSLVFVEVRSSRIPRSCIAESVDSKKQIRLKRTSQYWLMCFSKNYPHLSECRFDLLLVHGENLEHWVGAIC